MTSVGYSFVGGNLLEERHSYTYTTYQGQAFLEAWQRSRQATMATIDPVITNTPPVHPLSPPAGDQVETVDLLNYLQSALNTKPLTQEAKHWLHWIIQRFEVSKRVHSQYQIINHRAKGNGDYRSMGLYVHLAEMLVISAEMNDHLPSLNALIKCLDTLCSYTQALTPPEKSRLARLIQSEASLVDALGKKAREHQTSTEVEDALTAESIPVTKPGLLPAVTFLAADTLRSRGYAQALLAHGYRLEHVLIVKAVDGETRWGQSNTPPAPDPGSLTEYFIPDLRIPLEETCAFLSNNVESFATGTVNDPEVAARLDALDPALVIFSGFGGELVGQSILERRSALLHMHAGWLPDYRGSTTGYYSWLREGHCGVSAILLSSEIDEGEILARKRYPAPSPQMDIDHVYDGAIRADLLITVMAHLHKHGSLPDGIPQDATMGDVFYIIHPVLKHLAIVGAQNT